jgi:hypothetical protein
MGSRDRGEGVRHEDFGSVRVENQGVSVVKAPPALDDFLGCPSGHGRDFTRLGRPAELDE